MTVRFHPDARQELLEAARYYRENVGTDVARAFALAYLDAKRQIEQAPERSRLRAHGTRRVNLNRFPYYIAYLLETEVLWIVAVGHAARRPFYWKERAGER